ncbi:MAG: sulfatase/phosphatase domain-containing protein, partial [Bacteroidota bacterium]
VVSTPAFIKHTPPTINDPLREGKGTVYEGGIREPFIFKWKGKIAENVDSDQVITTNDLMNTFSALAESNYRTEDGIDATPALFGDKLPPRKLLMHFPHYTHQGGYPGGTVHDGNYKLIHWYESDSLELYDVVNDPGETTNIADQNEDLVDRLHQDLLQWKQSINAREVELNPEYQQRNIVD